MKILRHTPETITVSHNGNVLIYNLDEVRRKAIHDEEQRKILLEFVKFRVKEREQ